MLIHQEVLELSTRGKGFSNFTAEVERVVQQSGVRTGIASVFVQHTSASLVIQENADPAVLRDLERWFSDLAPESRRWEHDDEGPDDMPAHARASLTRTSETIPIVEGGLGLGTWQGIYLFEHRARAHVRRVVVVVSGV
ncbi:MAG TPA: secondary thiamine-phosphate synthase enzyme YjbQ [Polyangiaceae bacterium]